MDLDLVALTFEVASYLFFGCALALGLNLLVMRSQWWRTRFIAIAMSRGDRSELVQCRQELKVLRSEYEASLRRVSELERELDQTRTTLGSCRRDLENCTRDLDDSQRKVAELRSEIERLTQRVATLTEQVEQRQDQLGKARALIAELEVQLRAALAELELLRQRPPPQAPPVTGGPQIDIDIQLKATLREVMELRSQLAACEGRRARLEIEVEELRVRLRTARDELDELRARLTDRDARVHALTLEIEELKARLRTALSQPPQAPPSHPPEDHDHWHTHIHDVQTWRRRLASSQRAREILEVERAELSTKIVELEARLRRLSVANEQGHGHGHGLGHGPGHGHGLGHPAHPHDAACFGVHTRLLGEREIDVDDREARVELSVDMHPAGPWRLSAKNVEVWLEFDLDDRNVAINGKTRGPLKLGQALTLVPGKPFVAEIKVSTGIFSGKPDDARSSAQAGYHPVDVRISYKLAPLHMGDLEVRAPMSLAVAAD